MARTEGRGPHDLRAVSIRRRFTRTAPGSVLIRAGGTTVLCTASVEDALPPWKKDQADAGGWVTAEYSMLPGSTSPRKRRDRERVDGRTTEIQRLIGRSLRAVVDLVALGPRTVTVDCDVLEADGGTRTLAITGGYVALVDAVRALAPADVDPQRVLPGSVAAVSVGIVAGDVLLDLDYAEDSRADVDMNVVQTGDGRFVELQGTAERGTFDETQLASMLSVARAGLDRLAALQRQVLAD